MMHFVDSLHECSHTHIVSRIGQFLAPVVHGIELAHLVTVTYLFKEDSDLLSGTRKLEIILCDTHLCESTGEEKVNSFWLITIVLYNKVELKSMDLHYNQQ
jgi:hypothetical protein